MACACLAACHYSDNSAVETTDTTTFSVEIDSTVADSTTVSDTTVVVDSTTTK